MFAAASEASRLRHAEAATAAPSESGVALRLPLAKVTNHMTTTPIVRGALLVGSINLPDAGTAIGAAAAVLGERLKRIPDGEPGVRWHWLTFQGDIIARGSGLERVGDQPVLLKTVDLRPVRIADGATADDVRLPSLGYAAAAIESYQAFRALREAGVVPAGVRFEVALPTPAAVTAVFVVPEDRASFEPVYEAALARELDELLAAIPHGDLAIQWDTAVEFMFLEAGGYEGAFAATAQHWFGDDVWTAVIDRAVGQASLVPADVEVGFHLCYGDAGEEHFVQPTDAANLVRFANALTERAPRAITWIHLPVPIERDDADYFAPLADLRLQDDTELYLGLVHREDGPEGARRRIAAAAPYVAEFGVGTECGIGRAPEGTAVSILETHRVAAAW
jgi:hypothetical protein